MPVGVFILLLKCGTMPNNPSYLKGDHVVNLREDVLMHRIRYSLTTLDESSRELSLEKAVRALEK